LVGYVTNAEVWEWGLSRSWAWAWFRLCSGPGGVRGKAVAARWRVTGGAGHFLEFGQRDLVVRAGNGCMRVCVASAQESRNERADWPLSQSRGRVAGALLQLPFSVVGCGCGCTWHLGRGVACSGGRRFEWCVHPAHTGFSGGSLSGTTMNWRGRTVEYSSDPAKRPLVEVPCVDFSRYLRPLPDL